MFNGRVGDNAGVWWSGVDVEALASGLISVRGGDRLAEGTALAGTALPVAVEQLNECVAL